MTAGQLAELYGSETSLFEGYAILEHIREYQYELEELEEDDFYEVCAEALERLSDPSFLDRVKAEYDYNILQEA